MAIELSLRQTLTDLSEQVVRPLMSWRDFGYRFLLFQHFIGSDVDVVPLQRSLNVIAVQSFDGRTHQLVNPIDIHDN